MLAPDSVVVPTTQQLCTITADRISQTAWEVFYTGKVPPFHLTQGMSVHLSSVHCKQMESLSVWLVICRTPRVTFMLKVEGFEVTRQFRDIILLF